MGLNQNTEDGKNWVLNQLMWLLYNFMSGCVISKNKCKGFSIVVVFSYFSIMPCVEYSSTIFLLIGQIQMLWPKAMSFDLAIA